MDKNKLPEHTKKQHFVPQFLIRKFYNSSKRLEGYSFRERKIIYPDADDICSMNYLYEWDMVNFLNYIEKVLSKLESRINVNLNNTIDYLNSANNNKEVFVSLTEDIKEMCKYTIIQRLRMPDIINQLPQIVLKGYAEFLMEMACRENEEVRKQGLQEELKKLLKEDIEFDEKKKGADEAFLKGEGLKLLFEEDLIIEYIYNLVMSSHKVVIKKSNNFHFVSSDEPVMILGEVGEVKDMFNTSNFYLPITPNYILCLIVSNGEYDELIGDRVILQEIQEKEYEKILRNQVAQAKKLVYTDKITKKMEDIINEILDAKEELEKYEKGIMETV